MSDQIRQALDQINTRCLYLMLLCWGGVLLGTTLGDEIAKALKARTNTGGESIFTAPECAEAFLALSDLYQKFFNTERQA